MDDQEFRRLASERKLAQVAAERRLALKSIRAEIEALKQRAPDAPVTPAEKVIEND